MHLQALGLSYPHRPVSLTSGIWKTPGSTIDETDTHARTPTNTHTPVEADCRTMFPGKVRKEIDSPHRISNARSEASKQPTSPDSLTNSRGESVSRSNSCGEGVSKTDCRGKVISRSTSSWESADRHASRDDGSEERLLATAATTRQDQLGIRSKSPRHSDSNLVSGSESLAAPSSNEQSGDLVVSCAVRQHQNLDMGSAKLAVDEHVPRFNVSIPTSMSSFTSARKSQSQETDPCDDAVDKDLPLLDMSTPISQSLCAAAKTDPAHNIDITTGNAMQENTPPLNISRQAPINPSIAAESVSYKGEGEEDRSPSKRDESVWSSSKCLPHDRKVGVTARLILHGKSVSGVGYVP